MGLPSLLRKVLRPRPGVPPHSTPAAGAADAAALIARADAARDVGQYHLAATTYDEALRLVPRNAAIQVQCGHMFKEVGDLERAEARYLAAGALTPDDPDLALQLGHFYKVARRPAEAEAAYERALGLNPGWAEPTRELQALQAARREGYAAIEQQAAGLGLAGSLDQLVPELTPRPAPALRPRQAETIQVSRLGARRERTRWGVLHTWRGIEAVRGYCISGTPLSEVQVVLGTRVVHSSALQAFPLDAGPAELRKHVFNIWLDTSPFDPGLHDLELRFLGEGGGIRRYREQLVVAPALPEASYPQSDALLDPFGPDAGGAALEELINARPSVVRAARRSVFAELPRTVLVMRTDQLGDMVTSIPAVRRLRELLPGARLIGLLTAANAEFAATLGLFDEVLVAEFPDDAVERRRVMTLPAQDALRQRLHAYDFDLALDLAESAVSRPLLLLSGARFLYGFSGGDWPWLDGSFEGNTPDRRNGLEGAAQSTKVLALVERLGAALHSRAEVVRRGDLTRDMLAPFGVSGGQRFVVLHTGARIAFSRWPGYPELASLLLRDADLRVFLMTDDAGLRGSLPADLVGNARFQVLDQRLPFDQFDALLSYCDVFVGNDSGPKHLASLRGANVVSIHAARINWNDWAQEQTGLVISRKVPCAGCLIYHDSEECGKGFACITGIAVSEVFDAVARYL